MAQPDDTITYTFSGEREDEDISDVGEIEIEYIDGAGGEGDVDGGDDGGAGGRVENVVAGVSDYDTLYIWVGETGDGSSYGRYIGGTSGLDDGDGAGSSEVSVLGTDQEDSDTEPFIAAAGGGGGAAGGADFLASGGCGGARGGEGDVDAEGNAPPQGGDGGADAEDPGFPGDGAVSGHSSDVPIIDAGATTEGGGAPTDTDGEIRIAYKEGQDPPEPPQNLTAELL